jgi:hypothetical protein
MGDSAHTTHHTDPETKSAPPPFLEDENIFQKSASVGVGGVAVELSGYNHGGRFLKNVFIFEKKGGC